MALGVNYARDFAWSVSASYGDGVNLVKTNNWGLQLLGQEIWSTIAVLGLAPILAIAGSRIYKKESWKDWMCYFEYASVFSIIRDSCLEWIRNTGN